MSIFACLDQPPPARADMLIGDGLFNVAGSMIFGCIALVALFAPLIRRAYRKHVVRLMGLDQVQPRPVSWWKYHEEGTSKATAADRALQAPARVPQSAHGREGRLALATACAWLAFTVLAWPMGNWILTDPSLLGRLELLAGAGLASIIPLYANLSPRWRHRIFWPCVAAAVVLLVGLEVANRLAEAETAFNPNEKSSLWEDMAAALIVLGVVYVLFHRRLRGLVFPVSAVLTSAVLAFVIPLALVEPYLGSCLSGFHPSGPDQATAEQFWSGSFVFGLALLLFLGVWLGFRVIGLLARMIEKGYISDLSMISLIGMALVAIFIVFWAIGETADSYSVSVAWAPAVWLLAPVAAYRLALGKQADNGPGRDLLVLRVFSRDKKKQAFLDELQSRWRYIGAVNLAGGPDMVDLNVDTYECAMFLSSRLHELFLPEALDARHLRARFNNQPDKEGRYRVNEMFNFNTAWRENVEQLILSSDTILLDVRGLTAEREGTSFEIGLLASHGLLDRVIAVGDELTDWQHVGRQLQQHGQDPGKLRRIDSDKDVGAVLTRLLKVADSDGAQSTDP